MIGFPVHGINKFLFEPAVPFASDALRTTLVAAPETRTQSGVFDSSTDFTNKQGHLL